VEILTTNNNRVVSGGTTSSPTHTVMIFKEKKMRKFIAVVHSWHVHSKGFKTKEIEAETKEQAEKESKLFCYEIDAPFNKSAVKLIEIGENECVKPIQLSLKERITGKINR
jgi:hypothetical protein